MKIFIRNFQMLIDTTTILIPKLCFGSFSGLSETNDKVILYSKFKCSYIILVYTAEAFMPR